MALQSCQDCGQQISDQAPACPHCGCPGAPGNPMGTGERPGPWSAVLRARTPINLFSLAMMACAAVLGVSATSVDGACSLIAFTYTLHVFLAITGMFFVTLLFNRGGIYHPDDLARARREGEMDPHRDRPGVAAALIAVMLAAYGVYQVIQDVAGVPACA